MKKILTTILFSLIITPLAAFGADIDIKIKGVGVGTAYSVVLKQLGKPLKIADGTRNECVGEDEMYLRYNGITLYLLGNKKTRKYRVTGIEVTAPEAVIAPKVKIGMTTKEVQAIFGAPGSKGEDEDAIIWYYEGEGYTSMTSFSFKNGKLIKINHSEIIC